MTAPAPAKFPGARSETLLVRMIFLNFKFELRNRQEFPELIFSGN